MFIENTFKQIALVRDLIIRGAPRSIIFLLVGCLPNFITLGALLQKCTVSVHVTINHQSMEIDSSW